MSTQKIPKLLKQRENETWISNMLQKGGEVPRAVVLTTRTQMHSVKRSPVSSPVGKVKTGQGNKYNSYIHSFQVNLFIST